MQTKLSPENLCQILWSLEELSSESEQRRLWLSDGAGGVEVSSFTEACCQLFDDTRLMSLLENDGAFGEPLDQMLRGFAAQLVEIEDVGPEILADFRLVAVRRTASLLLVAVSKTFN